MTPDKVEEIVKEFHYKYLHLPHVWHQLVKSDEQLQSIKPVTDWLRTTLTQYHQDLIEDILKMADALEIECGKDGDKGTKQWMAFKGFRNTIRDKYIIKSK